MNPETKQILARWQSIEKGAGLQPAVRRARVLWLIGLGLCLFATFGVVYGLHPALIAISAAAMGWVVAECNALRTRAAQWPIFRDYIDWVKVENDLGSDDKG